MTHMTPEQGQFVLDMLDDGIPESKFAPDILRTALETIAAMREEYIVRWRHHPDPNHCGEMIFDDKDKAERFIKTIRNPAFIHILTRYVLDPDQSSP